jgi:CheY-like chemotaxis protein
MTSEAEFASHVANAYEYLYDLVYLRTHPLLDVLGIPTSLPDRKRARQLHSLLLDAIDELDPGPQAPVFSREWRRHRLMVLRYVKGLAPQAAADQLSISLRHTYRVHKTAIEDIAGVLWDRYVARHPTPQQASPIAGERETPPSRLELLRLEAARMAQGDRYARIGNVIDGAISILKEIAGQRGLCIERSLPRSLPDVSIDRSLLRQMLLGMLGYLIEYAEQATIRVTAQINESAVFLSLTVDPPEVIHAVDQDKIEDRLATIEEMALLSDAHVLPTYAGQQIVGFDLHLSTAERTVLVVDDNEDVLSLFRRYLRPHHYHVVTAQTAREALDQARQLQPYAITLDLMMPDQDGWELLQALLHQHDTRHIPIVVCSVLKQKDLALSLGATSFLEKPITEQGLVSALAALEER